MNDSSKSGESCDQLQQPPELRTDGRLLFSAAELGKQLGRSPRTIRRWDSLAKIPRPVVINGAVFWRVSDITHWVDLGCPTRDAFEEIKNE